MPLSDLPQSILFVVFLALFVLIGIYPAWKRSLRKLQALFKTKQTTAASAPVEATPDMRQAPAVELSAQLSDFENLVLWRMSQIDTKGLSRKQLNSGLHLEALDLRKALESLLSRGLVQVSITSFMGVKFQLSEQGRNYAIAQGYISKIFEQKGII